MSWQMSSGAAARNNVQVYGPEDAPALVFAHGFGTDQTMWGKILPWFTDRYRVVLLDHVGSGGSDQSAYDSDTYSKLDGYVDDLLEVCAELGLEDATLIGHSVGSMMAVSAAVRDTSRRFGRLVLVTASPSYLDHPEEGYAGGFTRQDIDDVFESLDANYVVWAESMAPVYMNTPHAPELEHEIQGSFGRISPRVARDFARVALLEARDNLGQLHLENKLCCRDAQRAFEFIVLGGNAHVQRKHFQFHPAGGFNRLFAGGGRREPFRQTVEQTCADFIFQRRQPP